MTTLDDAHEFLVELISQLFHAECSSPSRLSGCVPRWPGHERRRHEPRPRRSCGCKERQ